MTDLYSLLQTDTPLTHVFYGDSITHGVLHTFGGRCFAEHFTERVRFELGRADDVVLNTAYTGLNTRQLREHFAQRVARFRPDVLWLMAGMNDCNTRLADGQFVPQEAFRANLAAMIDAVRGWGGQVVLQTCTPVWPGLAPERSDSLPAYNAATRALAAEQGVLLVDHAAEWHARSDRQQWYMADAFHPNAHGHVLMAHTLFRALGIFDPAAPSCQLFVP
ncbi:SGNH/GDSL hydrolase family protein [Chitinilyticum piscinae]|uniref:SGNH/GDSL hydrolase family protein n=1 Tax=Chitinilyticum piscinae TaxID=2866724 RepID=A0A8J7K9A9_9NEIS|nr:SGNH/GDSL hydrolase family protein [Chitinilyticum piscinae]MBE9607804.1 SGNH/GDSL hydrolase family protein [Chitinilyticum piscinae]